MKKRYREFVAAYLIDLDAVKAAIRAGYSERNAHSNSFRLLRIPEIAAAVEEGLAARRENTRATADRVLEEYGRIAFADIRHFADWTEDGVLSLAAKEKLSDADAGAIHEVQPNGKGAKLKLYDKQAALDRLARHLGLFDPHARLSPQDQTVDGKAARDELRERLMRHFKKAGTE